MEARNANKTVVAPMVDSSGVCIWRESARRLVLCLCVWQQSGFNRREDVFTYTLVYQDFLILYFRC